MEKIIRPAVEEELAKILPKWKKTDFLNGLKDDYHTEQMALILENQRLMDTKYVSLVHQIFKDSIIFDIISVQTMLGPASPVYFHKYASREEDGKSIFELIIEGEDVAAKTRKIATNGGDKVENTEKKIANIEFTSNGQIPEEKISETATAIRNAIEGEVLTDIRNNVCTIATFHHEKNMPTYEEIYIKLVEISSIVHRKTLMGPPRWIVVNQEIADVFPTYSKLKDLVEPTDKIYHWGTLNYTWKVFVDPNGPREILIGLYSQPYTAGYIYCPYLPIGDSATVLEVPIKFLLTRYGKKLTRIGAKFYARLKFEKQ